MISDSQSSANKQSDFRKARAQQPLSEMKVTSKENLARNLAM